MKLLFIANYVPYFLSHRMPLTKAAIDAGYDVHIAIPPHPDMPQISRLPVNLIPYKMSRTGINPAEMLWTVSELRKIIAVVKPDIVHSLPLKCCLYGNLALKKSPDIPSISAVNGLGYIFTGKSLRKSFMQTILLRLLRYAFSQKHQKIIFQNADDRGLFINTKTVQESNSCIIHGSGVDTKKFRYVPELDGEIKIVFPARLLRDKGIYEFVQAAWQIHREGINAHFILAGNLDPLNPTAVTEAEVNHWQNNGIEWIGQCEDMPSLYEKSHIICLPSYREGLSKSLIEALSCGRAICTTDTPGCRQMLPEKHKELLSPVADCTTLAKNLKRLITDKNLRYELGQWGRQQAEKIYSLESINQQTLDIYSQLLTEK